MRDFQLSRVEICNMALGYIGQSNYIQDVEESSAEASVLRRFYDKNRRALLAAIPWNFARAREVLAQVSDFSSPKWRFGYSMPSRCIQLLNVFPDGADGFSADFARFFSGSHFSSAGWNFELELFGGVSVICTNAERAFALYTYDFEDTALFPPRFVEALVLKLAADISVPLTGGNLSTREQLLQQYAAALSFARTQDANECKAASESFVCEFLAARG